MYWIFGKEKKKNNNKGALLQVKYMYLNIVAIHMST